MVKSAKEASSAQGFLNNGLNLTSKQAKELSNDLDRLNIRLQHQGKSYQEITKEQAIYKQRFVEEANAVNRATSALAAVEKQRKDVVSAANYLTQAEAKMAAALNTSNVALDKAGTDSLVKYEAALRKSGISQDAATAKLATYKAQLTQVAGLEEKRRAQHLARALQPQFTDIAVSLYSGQSPLTVLLQQSGQMVDLFKLSGIEAANLGKVMREAFASMIPAIATVAKGLTSLVFESFMSAGSAVTRFIGNVTGITAAMEIAKRAIVSGGEANFKYIASLDKIGERFSAIAATGVAAMIAGMILLGLEYKKIIQAEAELTNALATSGGALGISKTEAIAAAEGMASFGVGTLKAGAAITEIAKAGNIGKESIDLITKSAVDLEKTTGISIEETVKQFAKLQEEPAKALTEIAQKTGLVDKATLDYVYALEQQGDKTEAARVATLAFASANAQKAAEARDNWSPVEVLWNDIKSAIGNVKQEIYDLTTSNAVVGALRTVWEAVAVTVSQVWFVIKGVGKEIGGIGAQIAAVMQGDFSGAAEIGRQMKADAASAAEEQEKYIEAILTRTSVEQKSFNQSKGQNSQYAKWRKENDQALDKSISKTDKYKAKELEMQKAVLAGTVSQIEADKALAGWKKIILGEEKTKKDPSEKTNSGNRTF
jgi:phage-related minor tail protein